MKNNIITLLVLCGLVPTAWAGVEADFGYTSDYVWRGATQTMGNGAWQGRLEVNNGGLYGGVWASQVDFNDDATYEMDLYGGYKWDLTNLWSLDVGVVQYNYDKGYDDVEEAFMKMGFGIVKVGYFVDLADSDKDFMKFNVDVPFVKWADVSLEYGMWDRDTDYAGLVLSKSWKDWTLGMLVMEEAKQGKFMDSASFTVLKSF